MSTCNLIKHHPDQQLLQQFALGELPASLSAAIAIHVDLCPHCQAQVDDHTQAQAQQCFAVDEQAQSIDFSAMIEQITADPTQDEPVENANLKIKVKDKLFDLPRALNSIRIGSFSGFGKISRAKIELGEGDVHSHLLYMAPQGEVPKHTHHGFELTLLLAGSFSDEHGDYHPGDLIMLDSNHHHQPYSEHGCLCMTVVSDALQFTEGLSRLLNPVGKYIY